MKLTRAPSADEASPAEATQAPARTLATPFGVDETTELLLDLLEATDARRRERDGARFARVPRAARP